MPNLFDIPMPDMEQPQPGVPQMGPMPIEQPPVASPEQMMLANLFRQQMAGPEDEELKRLRDREDEIYARIMKGPRTRAKELTAEIWKDRYGVDENSGKLRRIFAGLAETGRAIGGGAKYESIPDKARELATKEYQTEVGPLQREASVLSSAQKAVQAQADLTRYRNEQIQLQQARQAYLGAESEAKRQQILQMLPPKIAQMLAEERLTTVKADNAQANKGFGGDIGAAFAMQDQGPTEQNDLLKNVFQLRSAKGAADLAYNLKNFQTIQPGVPRTSTSVRPMRMGVGPDNKEIWENVRTQTTSTGAPKPVFDPNAAGAAVARFQQGLGMLQQATEAAAPKVITGPKGEVVEYRPTGKPAETGTKRVGTRFEAVPKWNDSLKQSMLNYFPDLDPDAPGSIPAIFQNVSHVALPKPLTKEQVADRAAIEGGKRLSRNLVTQYIKGDLGSTVGVLGGKWGALQRARGKATTGQIAIDTQAKENLSNYVRAMSGMATSRAELQRYKDIKPADTDNEVSFANKAMLAMIAGAQTEWMSGLNLPEGMRDRLLEDSTILNAPIIKTADAMKHLEAAKIARRNGWPSYTISEGGPQYPTDLAEDIVWNMVTGVNREMQDAFVRLFPDGGSVGPAATAIRKKK